MPTSIERDDASRFAHIVAVLSRLRSILQMYDDAAEVFLSLPRLQRVLIEDSVDSSSMNMTHGLARTAPHAREQERQSLLQDVHALETLLDNHNVPKMRFDNKDLDLIIDFIIALDMLQPRSKRELGRLFDAIRANDIGTLVVTAQPSKGNARQRLEVVFSTEGPLPVIQRQHKAEPV